MLILTTKPGESITIGENIKVTVSLDKSGNIRLGVDAPKDILILREKVLDKEQNA